MDASYAHSSAVNPASVQWVNSFYLCKKQSLVPLCLKVLPTVQWRIFQSRGLHHNFPHLNLTYGVLCCETVISFSWFIAGILLISFSMNSNILFLTILSLFVIRDFLFSRVYTIDDLRVLNSLLLVSTGQRLMPNGFSSKTSCSLTNFSALQISKCLHFEIWQICRL